MFNGSVQSLSHLFRFLAPQYVLVISFYLTHFSFGWNWTETCTNRMSSHQTASWDTRTLSLCSLWSLIKGFICSHQLEVHHILHSLGSKRNIKHKHDINNNKGECFHFLLLKNNSPMPFPCYLDNSYILLFKMPGSESLNYAIHHEASNT